MSVSPPPKFVLLRICDIIERELDLSEGTVFIYNQKINLSTMPGLLVAVGLVSLKPFGNTLRYSADGVNQEQSVNMNVLVSIDAFSRDDSALNRKEEIIMALAGTYAQQVQQKYGFNIGRIPTNFINLSEVEGAAIPFRFQATVQVQYAVKKIQSVDYYDQFSDTTTTEA